MSFEIDTIVCGDCLDMLAIIPDASVDAVITDPPYPHIKRDYGYWTEAEWWTLIVEGVVPQVRRILKPTGSAVFILQPNSRKVGAMRGWLWEFMAWVCREWNMVQDVWWWNTAAMTTGVCTPRERNLTRASLKACVWCGLAVCYRIQDAVLLPESQATYIKRLTDRTTGKRHERPSGQGINQQQTYDTIIERGGVTPFNVLPMPNTNSQSSAGANGHGAGTPLVLMDWWLRYIVPPGGVVVDPFMGSGTTALAAIKQRKHFMGCDKVQSYVDIANRRIEEACTQLEMTL